MKHIRNLLITVLFLNATNVKGQNDTMILELARKALDANHNCESSLNFLNSLSPDGKKSQTYYLLMGRAEDCKMNNQQALFYYNKFVESDPGNDSVKLRIAQLKDNASGVGLTANELRVTKADAAQTKNLKKNRKKKVLRDNFVTMGLGYVVSTGANAPFGSGVSIDASSDFLKIKDKALIEFSSSSQFMFHPNADWFSNAFGLTTNESSAMSGFTEIVTLGLMPILRNKKTTAIAAGPYVGFVFNSLGVLPVNSFSNYDNVTMDQFALCYGLKVNYVVTESLLFNLNLNIKSITSIDNSSSASLTGSTSVPVNLTTISLGITYKFTPWMWFW